MTRTEMVQFLGVYYHLYLKPPNPRSRSDQFRHMSYIRYAFCEIGRRIADNPDMNPVHIMMDFMGELEEYADRSHKAVSWEWYWDIWAHVDRIISALQEKGEFDEEIH